MALSDSFIHLAGLCKIELPLRTILLCDGAFVVWGSETYLSQDEDFGTIDTVDRLVEAISDEAPSGKLTMLPPSVAAAADLFQPDAQGSPMTFWLAEIDPATGSVVGTPETMFSGFVDNIKLTIGKTRRTVDIEFVSQADRLFWTREGNVLSDRFHKDIWPGELGLVYATSAQYQVPWGVAGPGRGTISFGGGGGGGGAGGGTRGGVPGGQLVHSF